MKKKEKKQKDLQKEFQKSKMILLILFALILCFSFFLWVRNEFVSKQKKPDIQLENRIQVNGVKTPEVIQEETNQLTKKSDPARIKYYLNEYLGFVENGKYDQAYEMLYADFKKNYFPTLEQFMTYAKEKYGSFIRTEYVDMQRQGNIYVVEVKIQDPLQTQNVKRNFTQKFIIQEQSVNEYVLSFEVVK